MHSIKINHRLCRGCKRCYEICPSDIFIFNDKLFLLEVRHPDECWYCGACLYECSEGALELKLPLACL